MSDNNDDSMSDNNDDQDKVGVGMWLIQALASAIYIGIALVLFSQMSPVFLQVTNAMVDYRHLSVPIAAGSFFMALLVVWFVRHCASCHVAIGLASPLFVCAGAALFLKEPLVAPACVALLVPAFVDKLHEDKAYKNRTSEPLDMMRRHMESSRTLFLCLAASLMVAWGAWIMQRSPTTWTDWPEEIRAAVKKGDLTWKVAFLAWLLPLSLSCQCLGFAVLTHFRLAQVYRLLRAEKDLASEDIDEQSLKQDLRVLADFKGLLAFLFGVVMLLWIFASIDVARGKDVDLNSEREGFTDDVMRLACFCFIVICIYLIFNIGVSGAAKITSTSINIEKPSFLDGVKGAKTLASKMRVVSQARDVFVCSWAKAGYLLACAPLLTLHWLFCGKGSEAELELPSLPEQMKVRDSCTYFCKLVVLAKNAALRYLVRTEIMMKSLTLGFCYVAFKFTAVGTLVALVATSDFLGGINLSVWYVSLIIYIVGTFLFLLPPTPGVPVYFVTGLVITAKAMGDGMNFCIAAALSVAVGSASKMSFMAIAQKGIGEPLGGYVAVKSLCQVHTVEIRAIEFILREEGITLGKVAMLIGGPDWPVAVLCGILRLNVVKVLLATSPVIVQSVIPCVMAGALYASAARGGGGDSDGHTQSLFAALGGIALALAALLQAVALLAAGYYTQAAIEKHYDELSKPRPEDQQVIDAEQKASEEERAFLESVGWESLPCMAKLLLCASFSFIWVSCSLLSGPVKCFIKFGMTSSIKEDLHGDVLAIVTSLGWAAVGLCGVSALLFACFRLWARRHHASEGGHANADQSAAPLIEGQ